MATTKGITKEEIEKAKPRGKRYTLCDKSGLLIVIHPTGKKSFVVRYRQEKKEHRKQIGDFPALELKDAREIAEQIKGKARRREFEKEKGIVEIKTFEEMAEEWLEVRIKPKSPAYYYKTQCRLKHLYDVIGTKKITEIKPSDILEKCRELEKEKKTDTAHRIRATASLVFAFAIAKGETDYNPALMLSGALEPHEKQHYKAIINPRELETLMRLINKYNRPITRITLLFSALTFARPGEIRKAEWSEIDWSNKCWRIPAEKMKMKRAHIVPLSTQAITLLKELKELTNKDGTGRYLFPSERGDGRHISENTVLTALHSLNYKIGEITAHGFRTTASTVLNEHDFRKDYVQDNIRMYTKL